MTLLRSTTSIVGWADSSRPTTPPVVGLEESAHPTRSGPLFRALRDRIRSEEQAPQPRPKPIYALARPRRMKHCARGVLLWSLSFYALAALALNLVMDRWCPNLAESLYRTKWEGLCRLTTEASGQQLVVMLGSSRADGNFQAGRLDGLPGPDGQPLAAYNFGIPKAGPIHE